MSMVESVENLRTALPALVDRYASRLPVIEAVCTGQLAKERLQRIAARMHAETRAAIQVKLPERLRICPIEASEIRRYWCQQLTEESGEFQPGQDHASMFAPVCLALGVTREQLEAEFECYLPSIDYLRESPISLDMTLREAAQVYVEEAVLARHADRIGEALRDHYGVPESDLRYFPIHGQLDVEHSAAGLEALVSCARTGEEAKLVQERAETVLNQFPIWAVDIRDM